MIGTFDWLADFLISIWHLKKNVDSIWPLHWRHNGRDSVSNHQPHDCLFNRLFRRRSKKISQLRVNGLCVGISPGTGEFPAQMASNAKMFPFDDVTVIWKNVDGSALTPSIWGWYSFPSKNSVCVKYMTLHTSIIRRNYHEQPLDRICLQLLSINQWITF